MPKEKSTGISTIVNEKSKKRIPSGNFVNRDELFETINFILIRNVNHLEEKV